MGRKSRTKRQSQNLAKRPQEIRQQKAPQGVLFSQQREQVEVRESIHIGPLPDPETFPRYDEIVPGMAERLLNSYELQGAHRQRLESWALRGNVIQSFLGLVCATGITLFVIFQCTKIIMSGHSVEGIVGIISNLAILAGVFVYGRNKQDKELKEKNK
ncbi:MAG: DUF2335 domain-containing protein [Trueperaceae bacterium]